MKFKQWLILFFVLLAMSDGVAGEERVTLTMTVEKEVYSLSETGEQLVSLVHAKRVVPGEVVVFTTNYKNNGQDIADNVLITNPIPEQMTYLLPVEQIVSRNITYSVDGGLHFDIADALLVEQENGEQVPATSKDYTHIRWKIEHLAPGEAGQVTFRAQLN